LLNIGKSFTRKGLYAFFSKKVQETKVEESIWGT